MKAPAYTPVALRTSTWSIEAGWTELPLIAVPSVAQSPRRPSLIATAVADRYGSVYLRNGSADFPATGGLYTYKHILDRIPELCNTHHWDLTLHMVSTLPRALLLGADRKIRVTFAGSRRGGSSEAPQTNLVDQ